MIPSRLKNRTFFGVPRFICWHMRAKEARPLLWQVNNGNGYPRIDEMFFMCRGYSQPALACQQEVSSELVATGISWYICNDLQRTPKVVVVVSTWFNRKGEIQNLYRSLRHAQQKVQRLRPP